MRKIHCADTSHATLVKASNSLSVGFIIDLVLPNLVEIEIIQDMNKQATL